MTDVSPSSSNAVSGNIFQRNDESVNALSGISDAQKQNLNNLLEKVQQYSQLFNGAYRFLKSPFYIRGELRDYQIEALNWLVFLYENKVCGILGDESGLGKSMQSISILGYLKFFKNINGPFLVIGTTSMVSSWMDEFKKFCPDMKVIPLINQNLERVEAIKSMKESQWDVCVTTFEMVSNEIFFRQCRWRYVVIDEAQRLTDENTKFMREIPSEYRLLLTGTPLQNNLHDLCVLLNYLMPDIFDTTDVFDDCGEEHTKSIQEILQPFLLRRMKADVETSLLPKIEMKLFVGLTKLQRNIYLKTIDEAQSHFRTKKEVLQSLRKIANHPYLIRSVVPTYETDDGEHLISTSCKMMVLHKLLPDLKRKGSVVLLFSQYNYMLDIIEDYLIRQNYTFCRLGQAKHRKANEAERINAKNINIFIYIIPTRHGTLGIDLQTANTVVILYDSDCNPQIDLQAIDRVHRIGRKNQVHVFRFITENTIDEFIAQRAEVKLRLNNMMVERGRRNKNSKETFGVKWNDLRFGIDSIQASDAAGITDLNLDELITYSEIKTAEENKKFDKMNEDQLRSIETGETSVVPVNNNETSTRMTRKSQRNCRLKTTDKNEKMLPTSRVSENNQNIRAGLSTDGETLLDSPSEMGELVTEKFLLSRQQQQLEQQQHRDEQLQQHMSPVNSPKANMEDSLEMVKLRSSESMPLTGYNSKIHESQYVLPQQQLQNAQNQIKIIRGSGRDRGGQARGSYIKRQHRQPRQTVDQSQHIIETGARESAKVLVVLQSGEQRLIIFTTPKGSCTVQELLKRVGVPFTEHTNIECFVNPGASIDYLITVGVTCSGTPSEIISAAENTPQFKQMQQQQQQQLQEQIHQQTQQQKPSLTNPKGVDTAGLATQENPAQAESLLPEIVTGNLAVHPKCGVCRNEHYSEGEEVNELTDTDQKNGSGVSTLEFQNSDTPPDTSNSIQTMQQSNRYQFSTPLNEIAASPNHSENSIGFAEFSTVNETSSTPNSCRNGDSDTSANNYGFNQAIQRVNQHLTPANDHKSFSHGDFIHLNVYKFYPKVLVVMCDGNRLLDMSTNTKTKEALLAQGFQEWSYADYKAFCDAVQKYGRSDVASVAEAMPNKREEEILKYHEVFFRRGPKESKDIDNIITNIKFMEMSNRMRNKAFQWKMGQSGRPEFLSNRISQKQNAKFTHDHDRYLICAVSRYGRAFNVSDRVISDIRFHSDFGHFSTFRFGTISDQEITERINELVVAVRKEYMSSGSNVELEDDDNPKRRKLN